MAIERYCYTKEDSQFYYTNSAGSEAAFGTILAPGTTKIAVGDTDTFIQQSSDGNLLVGADSSISLEAVAEVRVTDGELMVGVNDTTPRGSLYLFSEGAGSDNGGRVVLYVAADYDTSIATYQVVANQDDLEFQANTTEKLAYRGGEDLWHAYANLVINGVYPLTNGGDLQLLGDGTISMVETTTPTADANHGKLYTKNDNKLYFQDGAGTEHEVAFV